MKWRHFLVLALSLSLTAVLGQSADRTPLATAPLDRFLPLDVTVNGAKGGTWPFVERAGLLYAAREALEEWRVELPPDLQPIKARGSEYLPLSAISGFTSKVNFANQSIDLAFSPQVFAATKLSTELSQKPKLSKVLPSVFLNYDLNYFASKPRLGANTTDLGALAEVGMSNSWGVLTSSQVGRNLSSSAAPGSPSGWLRLETTFTRDQPEINRTLRLGDAATRPGLWGRSAYFGGVQYGTNFALTPGYITQPLPLFRGLSTAPSTVELYVNDVLRQTSNVPTGPFAIDNIGALTGSGEARLVVRDLLGREVVIVQPFFTATELLASGLNDWSVEAGSLRRDLGVASSHYGKTFGSGTWRHGWSDLLTLEAHGEVLHDGAAAGLGGVAALPAGVLGKAALVASRDDAAGLGRHWLLGLERGWLRSAAQIQLEGSSKSYRSLGQDVSGLPIKFQAAGNVSYSTGRLGTIGIGFARIDRFDEARITTLSANYSVLVGKRSNLNVNVSRVLNGASGTSLSMSLHVPLDRNLQVSANAGRHGGAQDYYVTASQTPKSENGLGWRVLAGHRLDQAQAEGGLYYNGAHGRVTGDLSTAPDQTSARVGASGGLVAADGRFFTTKRIEQSFAVAEIKGFGGVGVGLGSSVLARTNADGIAVLPYLVPYQSNLVRVDAKDLPVSAEIGNIEQIVVPSWRSAVKVEFPVRSGRAALLRIRLADDDVAPAGAVVQIAGDEQEFFVARRGEAYVTGLQPANRLALRWKDQTCNFEVTLPPSAIDEIARIGPLLCTGVNR